MGKELLHDKIFIVTGGTQGLGRGIALYLAGEGAAGLVICGRNRDNGEAVANEINTAGTSCEFVQADLQFEKDCRKVVHVCDKRFGTVDGLVNAAGLTNRATLEDTTVESWDLLFNVNVRAPFILTQETVRIMKVNKIHGSIVNIISIAYHGGSSYLTAYSSSKGALATLTKNVAHTLRFDRIRVNGICMGWTYTPNEHEMMIKTGHPENWLELVEKEMPFGRIMRPQDVAYLVGHLLSDRSEMMTGSLIDLYQNVIGVS
jgi:NAD(P)-dependent dehydrogenase (short-subunit alcohol dehydrogenase family)